MVVPAQEHGDAPAEDVQPRLVLLQHGVAAASEAAHGLLPPPVRRRAHGGASDDRGRDRLHGRHPCHLVDDDGQAIREIDARRQNGFAAICRCRGGHDVK
jgi:hypothetical protein